MVKGGSKYVNLLLTIILSMLIGAVFMLILGYNPVEAYYQLFRGAFSGKLNFGTTLQKFVPVLLTGVAFAVSARADAFNAGIEGEFYLGALAAAWVGYTFTSLPAPIHMLLCFLVAAVVGALWAAIPAYLKGQWGVNEICVTILLTYVAKYITSYFVNGPMSANTGVPQTPTIADGVRLPVIMKPSMAHAGLFIAIVIVALVLWLMSRSTIGYQYTTVGFNPSHAAYMGISPKKTLLRAMMLSGCIGGIAGCIEVLGTYGYFLDNFSLNIANDGMLASLIVKNDIKLVPLMAFFLSMLKAGALGMERYAGVPRSLVDAIAAIFIIFATMEAMFAFLHNRKEKKAAAGQAA